jgi:hypothetical protein
MSDDIVNRLRCRYASGPIINGEPEFGYRDTSCTMEVQLPTPVMREAADRIEADAKEIARLKTVPMKYRRTAFNAQLQEENKALSTKLSTMGRKLSLRTRQRDKAIGRTRELQGYVTKYQREIVQLKKELRDARQQPD